jgi:hypothetical protein
MVQESEEAVQLKQVLDDARQPDNTAGARP